MNITKAIETIFKNYLPSPFSIAVILTLITFFMALIFTNTSSDNRYILDLFSYWEQGIWNNNLLVFAYQMLLILVLGHVLVLSAPCIIIIDRLTSVVNTSQKALLILSITTLFTAFFNWGLGLIFGAIFARKIAESCQKQHIPINYPLIGAAGYVGLMIWHGGISGSAPIKVSENQHLIDLMSGISSEKIIEQLPTNINFDLTVLSSANLITYAIVFVVIPVTFVILNKRRTPTMLDLKVSKSSNTEPRPSNIAERIDQSKFLALIFGGLTLMAFIYSYYPQLKTLQITPNALNLFMLGTAITAHGNFRSFLKALQKAVRGASGILIQFPLYFGIMGIMKDSGLILLLSDYFISISSATTLPIFTFISAGVVNIFVPSGGGQWAIQGPIIVEAAVNLGVPIEKVIMALAYGDQVTNMLQPFWALPLLAITGLKAKDILPYSLIIMMVGSCIFISSLLLW